MDLMSEKTSSTDASDKVKASGKRLKNAGVVKFTRLSVHCADRITATNNSNGFEYINSVSAMGTC